MDRILVATDFSSPARGALRCAQSLARRHDACLVLLHVHAPLEAFSSLDVIPVSNSFYRQLAHAAEHRLTELASLTADAGIRIERIVRHGPVGPTIVATAAEERADLLVIGRSGLNELDGTVGGTSAFVVREAECPVLTVRPADSNGDAPLRADVKTILVATDFSLASRLAGRAATSLVAQFPDVRLVLCHAYHAPAELTALTSTPIDVAQLALIHATATARLEEWSQPFASVGLAVETIVRHGRPLEVIQQTAIDTGADVIALATPGPAAPPALMRVSSERLSHLAPCHVLSVVDRTSAEHR